MLAILLICLCIGLIISVGILYYAFRNENAKIKNRVTPVIYIFLVAILLTVLACMYFGFFFHI